LGSRGKEDHKLKVSLGYRCRKSCYEIQHPFTIKTLKKLGTKGMYLNI
jgi:hypothetical protein